MIWGLALAGAIVLYDAWHKGNVFAPVIMPSWKTTLTEQEIADVIAFIRTFVVE